jgi:hypothetical protein
MPLQWMGRGVLQCFGEMEYALLNGMSSQSWVHMNIQTLFAVSRCRTSGWHSGLEGSGPSRCRFSDWAIRMAEASSTESVLEPEKSWAQRTRRHMAWMFATVTG